MKAAKIILFWELVAALAFGLCFNASLLRDADTWWLMGLGRWICEHHCLPASDPFSYTMAFQQGRVYVPHQWLSALVFYCTYNVFAIQGLLMLSVGVLFGAFVVLPLQALRKATSTWLAFGLVLLGVCASKFHFLARPEIFSYLFEALLLWFLTRRRFDLQTKDQKTQKKLDVAFIGIIFSVFAIWCNFHSGFIFGALVLSAYCATSVLIAIRNRSSQHVDFSSLVATALIPLAACVNPFGIKLLLYLKNQLWFDPFLNTIGEMTPISLSNPNFFPFFILLFVFVVVCCAAIRRAATNKVDMSFIFTSLCIVGPPVAVALMHRRAVLFAVLVILFECALLLHRLRAQDSQLAEKHGLRQYLPILVSLLAVPLAFVWFGADNRWDLNALRVVDKGIEFVRDNAHDRRIFNDFLLGDRMIWLTPEHPRVFLDTRYDMYGEKLVDEYDVISMGQPGWQNVLDKYQIEVVCFFKRSRIADLLSEEPGWARTYVDERTVVFERTIEK